MADRILKPDSGNDLVLQNDDASAKIEINEAGTIVHTGTSSIDVSGGTFTTSSAQKQAIVQAGPGSGTLDVSSGTFTTSSAQKQSIVQAGPGSGTFDVSSGTFTTSTAQKQAISATAFASGTKMLFQQTSAPTGWTKVTSSNDVALRVVSGTVGSGGSVAFETAFASQTIPTHTLSSSEIPNFTTRFNILYGGNGVNDPFSLLGVGTAIDGSGNAGAGVVNASWSQYNNVGVSGANVLMNAETGGGGGSHGHGSVDLDVSYVDVIIATKD